MTVQRNQQLLSSGDMALMRSSPCLLLALAFIYLLTSSTHATDEGRQVYIVYMGDQDLEDYLAESLHLNLLDQVLDGSSARESLVYHYKRSFKGFAAKLTDQEQTKLAGMEGVVSVFPSGTLELHTTDSWDYLRFPETVDRNLELERDVIIGVIDTGIWPESESFKDEGLGPPPERWKGVCQNFTCNNKIIGARYYRSLNSTPPEGLSPRDFEGHGSHTASTAAGRLAANASLYGLANGTARGAVPSARIAVYKVCWKDGCQGHDLLAAFDDAIADGVDIISISIGATSGTGEYFGDLVAIGAFHAMKKGILTSGSAGNRGPRRGTGSNNAPWMLVTAASSDDMQLIDRLVLGNNLTIDGDSVNTFPTEEGFYPFVSSQDGTFTVSSCDRWSLDENLVRGKIVLCDLNDGSAPLLAGAKGMVVFDDSGYSFAFPLPAVILRTREGRKLMDYINSTRNPVANIPKSIKVLDLTAPVIAPFSSRGPNMVTPDILKPDITAPGVNILAAWSPKGKISPYWDDTRSANYHIMSGTSMACPHTTGVAAYVKSFHPNWSPAAIMSALMTTARRMDPSYHRDAELAHGAGLINPLKARDPGLVYDATERDYVEMLCNQGYDTSKIRLVTGDNSSCPEDTKGSPRDLNYPSMAASVEEDKSFHVQFPRMVTNVGHPNSTYTARIKSGSKLNVTVDPSVLSFTKLDEKQKFIVTVSGGALTMDSIASASIIWFDGQHDVRSPIIVYTGYS